MTSAGGDGPGATRPPVPPGSTGGSTTASSAPSRWSWLLPVLTFLAGLVLGGVVIFAGTSGDDETLPSADASPSPGVSATEDPGGTEIVVRVPQSCLDAADGALAASEQVDAAVAAVRDLDARRLQEIVNEVQRLQPGVREQAQQCRSTAGSRIEQGQLAPQTPGPTATR